MRIRRESWQAEGKKTLENFNQLSFSFPLLLNRFLISSFPNYIFYFILSFIFSFAPHPHPKWKLFHPLPRDFQFGSWIFLTLSPRVFMIMISWDSFWAMHLISLSSCHDLLKSYSSHLSAVSSTSASLILNSTKTKIQKVQYHIICKWGERVVL